MDLDRLEQYGTALNTVWTLDAERTVKAVDRIEGMNPDYTDEECRKINHYTALYQATQLWRNPVNGVIGEVIDNGAEEYVRKIQLGSLVLELAQYSDTDAEGDFVNFTVWVDNPSTSLSEEDHTLHRHVGVVAHVSERDVDDGTMPSLDDSADTLTQLAAYCQKSQ